MQKCKNAKMQYAKIAKYANADIIFSISPKIFSEQEILCL